MANYNIPSRSNVAEVIACVIYVALEKKVPVAQGTRTNIAKNMFRNALNKLVGRPQITEELAQANANIRAEAKKIPTSEQTTDTVKVVSDGTMFAINRELLAGIADGMGNEFTSRINFRRPETIDELYEALAPDVELAEEITLELHREGRLPEGSNLRDMQLYACRILVAIFLKKFADELVDMAFEYDPEPIEKRINRDPEHFLMAITDNIKSCAGYIFD